jgi:hypothetical protein
MGRQLWVGIALIFVAQLAGFFSLRAEMVACFEAIDKRFEAIDKRFDDLKDWIRAELRRIDERLERLEHPIVR